MSRGASRQYRFEDVVYEDGSVDSYREALAQNVIDFLSTLHVVGGMLSIVAVRDELGVDPATGAKVFETRGAIVEWRQAAPIRNAPPRGTTRVDMDPAVLAPLPGDEPEAETPDPWAEDDLISEDPDDSEVPEAVSA